MESQPGGGYPGKTHEPLDAQVTGQSENQHIRNSSSGRTDRKRMRDSVENEH